MDRVRFEPHRTGPLNDCVLQPFRRALGNVDYNRLHFLAVWNVMRLLVKTGLAALAMCFTVTFFVAALWLAGDLGAAPTPYIAQDGLFMLAGALGLIGCVMKSRKLDQKYKSTLEAAKFTGDGLEADVSKGMIILVAALALFSLWVIYVVMADSPISRRALVPALAFLTFSMLMLSATLSLLRSGKPSLVMDTFALDHVWYGPIRWDQIQGIHLREIRVRGATRHSLALLVEKPGRYLMQRPWWLRVLISAKRRNAASGVIEIPLGALNKSALMTHKAAVALRARVSPPPLGFWVLGMSAAAIGVQREMDVALRRMAEIGQLIEHGAPDPDQIERQSRQVTADITRLRVLFDEAYWKSVSAITKRDRNIVIAILGGVALLFLLRVAVRML